MSRIIPVVVLAALICEPAIAQQPGDIPKPRAGAAASSIKAIPPSTTGIDGRMMIKPRQNFIGGKATAPTEHFEFRSRR